jgi:hypothetical protein
MEIHTASGSYCACLAGCGVELERSFRSAAAARRYLVRSFTELFPEHRCGAGCG